MASKHPGFAAVQKKIEGEGYGAKAAGAILAKKTRSASPAAKKKNPNLKKVKGSMDKGVHNNSGMNMNKGMSYIGS